MELIWYHYVLLAFGSISTFILIRNQLNSKRPFVVLKTNHPIGRMRTSTNQGIDLASPSYEENGRVFYKAETNIYIFRLKIFFPFSIINNSPHEAYNIEINHLKDSSIIDAIFPKDAYQHPLLNSSIVKIDTAVWRVIRSLAYKRQLAQNNLLNGIKVKLLISYTNMKLNRKFYTLYEADKNGYSNKKINRFQAFFYSKK